MKHLETNVKILIKNLTATAALVSLSLLSIVPRAQGELPARAGANGSGSAPKTVDASSVATARTLAQPNNEFGLKMMKQVTAHELAKHPNRNVFFSPVSAAMALELLLNGAPEGSRTATEMTAALGVNRFSLAQINDANLALIRSLESAPQIDARNYADGKTPKPLTLKIANSVWSDPESHFQFSQGYVATAANYFRASVQSTPFKSETGVSAINGWASAQTNGKIPKVTDLKTLSQLTFLLMNATYFKGNWENQFYKQQTVAAQPFRLADGKTVAVDMMKARRYGYTDMPEAQVIELPYAGQNAAMYVALPKLGQAGIKRATEALYSGAFWSRVAQAPKDQADLKLPKFSFSFETDLIESLKDIGMQTVFTENANLSRMGNGELSVGLVKQNTFVAVDETGTEAAAVTSIGVVAASMPMPREYPVMTVDHPFVVSIVEKTTGSILFLGYIANPSAK